jgi:hypothetical protein
MDEQSVSVLDEQPRECHTANVDGSIFAKQIDQVCDVVPSLDYGSMVDHHVWCWVALALGRGVKNVPEAGSDRLPLATRGQLVSP